MPRHERKPACRDHPRAGCGDTQPARRFSAAFWDYLMAALAPHAFHTLAIRTTNDSANAACPPGIYFKNVLKEEAPS